MTAVVAKDLASLVGPDVQQVAISARAKMVRLIEQIESAEPKYRDERFNHARRFLATEYLSATYRIREASPRHELEQLCVTLTDRLEAGFNMEPTPSRDQLWMRLLAEYEVVEDALSESVIWRYQDRLGDIEARYA